MPKIRIIYCNFAVKMANLHIFNPEHDIALASNLANFTAPHAAWPPIWQISQLLMPVGS